MSTSRAALRYAKALLLEADQHNTTDQMLEDMQSVYVTIQASKDLRLALANPIIKAVDKKNVLSEVFVELSQATHNLFALLVHNKRTDLLADIAKAYIDLYNEMNGIKEVEVITAAELTPELEAKILVKAKEISKTDKVLLTNKINPDLLGGFIIRVGGIEYNASVFNQFQKIKKEFTKSL